MSHFFLQLSVIFLSWFSVLLVTYFAVRWFSDQGLSLQKVSAWAFSIFIGIALTVLMYYFVPERYQDMFNVIAHQLACAAMVHLLLLRLDAYLRFKNHMFLSDFKLYGSVALLYFLMGLNSLVVIKLNSHILVEISQIAISYITRASILLCLIVEIKMRYAPVQKDQSVHDVFDDNDDLDFL